MNPFLGSDHSNRLTGRTMHNGAQTLPPIAAVADSGAADREVGHLWNTMDSFDNINRDTGSG